MYSNSISIIGCGNLGSALAYMIILKAMEQNNDIENLYLIDNDILENKNIPYLYADNKDYINKPKVYILKDMLSRINKNVKISATYETFPNIASIDQLQETYIIDCRDTPDESYVCSMKLNLDGQYGVINLNPINKDGGKGASRYVINSSKYYAMFFAGICCQIIFGDIELKNDKYIVDLKRGEFYETVSDKE